MSKVADAFYWLSVLIETPDLDPLTKFSLVVILLDVLWCNFETGSNYIFLLIFQSLSSITISQNL